ncbi:MAG: G8 domain-containing protein [Bacteroidota bacterium]
MQRTTTQKFRGPLVALSFLCLFSTLHAQRLWSDAASWPDGQVPTRNASVAITPEDEVILDVSPPPLKSLTVAGTLRFKDTDLRLTSGWILVSGRLEIGTEERPLASRITITLNGPDEDVLGMGGRLLATHDGGALSIHGTAAAKRSWTQLDGNLYAGDQQLRLAESTDWAVGEEIAIAPSGYDPYQAERVTITAISDRDVSFEPALHYAHFGERQEFAGRTVDERAEVGLLTRNITIQGPESAPEERYGGHIMIMPGSGPVSVSGVALRRLGQPGKAARYSFHWHLAGDRDGDYFRNSSVYDGLQRGVVVHGTNNVLVQDNVTFNVRNHAYIPAEDGNETGNHFIGNLAILTRRVETGYFAFPKEGKETKLSNQGEQRPSCFWLRNLHNVLIGNHAAGAERGNGFFYDRFARHRDFSFFDALPEPIVFQDNVAHSISVPGVNNNAGSNVAMYAQVGHGMGLFIDNFNLEEETPNLVFENFTAYKCDMSGIWNETEQAEFRGLTLADNTSAFLTGAGFVDDALVVGRSQDTIGGRNRVLRHGHHRAGYYTVSQGGKKRPRLSNVTFVNMHADTDNEAAAVIADYKLDMRENYVEKVRLENSRPLYMETSGAPGRTPSGATLFDKDGSLGGLDEPTLFLHPTSPLLRDDCEFFAEWNAYACPADQYLNLTIPRVDRKRFRVYLDQEGRGRIHDGGLNTRYLRLRTTEEFLLSFDEDYGPQEAFRLALSPHAASPGGFCYLRIPYPFDGVEITDDSGEPIPHGTSEAAVRAANIPAFFFDTQAGYLFVKGYAPASGMAWLDIHRGEQGQGDIPNSTSVAAPNFIESYQVAPNPLTEDSRLLVTLSGATEFSVDVLDVLGRQLRRPFVGLRPQGEHQIPLDLEDLPPGVYQLRLRAGGRPLYLPVSKF